MFDQNEDIFDQNAVGHLVSRGVVAALKDHVLREKEDARLPERRALVPQQLQACPRVFISDNVSMEWFL